MAYQQFKKSYKPLSKKSIDDLEKEVVKINEKINSSKISLSDKSQQLDQLKKFINLELLPLIQNYNQLLGNPKNYNSYWIFGRSLKSAQKARSKIVYTKLSSKIDEVSKKYYRLAVHKINFFDTINHTETELANADKAVERWINFYEEDISKLKSKKAKCLDLIDSKIRTRNRENAKRAVLARAEQKSRQLASTIKGNLKINIKCPYCGEQIDNGHVDHIYPVIKGGLSTPENMVYVCAGCNRKKSDFTLVQFICTFGYDRSFIENNLNELGKDY